ncbi:MAG: hypothetical protein ABIO86_12590 [Sphingomonas sp.]
MPKIWMRLATAFAVLFTVSATPAMAQATRTWVSGVGDDVNPCSRTAPCKTFAGAISKTAAGGEINCLDSAGFGAVTITKAITLYCNGPSNGGILASATNAVVINAGPTDAVVLSGLDIDGTGTTLGLNGVRFLAGGSLVVMNCNFRNFSTNGISFAPGGDAALHVIDTTFNKAGQGATGAGINIRPSSAATATVTITGTQITGGTFGIIADGSVTTGKIDGVVRDSVVSHNSQNGITASNGTAAHVTLLLDNVSVSGNGNKGLSAGGAGANQGMLVGNSTIFGNTAGLFTSGSGALVSYGNNRVNGNNGADGAFSSSVATK